VPRTRRVENLRHGARTTTAGTREGSTITVTASPHPWSVVPRSEYMYLQAVWTHSYTVHIHWCT